MVTRIKLENFKCPSCPDKGRKSWICAKDSNSVYVDEKGIMSCETEVHTGKVINWRWNCGGSYHQGEFSPADMEGFVFAMSQAMQLVGRAGTAWIASLITELGKQYNK